MRRRRLGLTLAVALCLVSCAAAGPGRTEASVLGVTESYEVPDIVLTDMNGLKVRLRDAIHDEQPIVLEFMFTTCSGICPIFGGLLAAAQEPLNAISPIPGIWSISIDPEADTPERLLLYAMSYQAGDNWRFFTGDPAGIVALQQAFGAYHPNKMEHEPLLFIHTGPGTRWTRIEGLVGVAQLVRIYRSVIGK